MKELNQQLYYAAGRGDIARMEWLVSQGANPRRKSFEYRDFIPLHAAAGKGQIAAMRWLVENGGSCIECDGSRNNSILHIAAHNGQIAAMEWLLVELNRNNIFCMDYINSGNAWGDRPLHCAAANGKTEAVKWLLAHGAEATIRTIYRKTPADHARAKGYTDLADLLDNAAARQQHAAAPAPRPSFSAPTLPVFSAPPAAAPALSLDARTVELLRGEMQVALQAQQATLEKMFKKELKGMRDRVEDLEKDLERRLKKKKFQMDELIRKYGAGMNAVDFLKLDASQHLGKQQFLGEMRLLLADELQRLEDKLVKAQKAVMEPLKQALDAREKVLNEKHAQLSVTVEQMKAKNDPMYAKYKAEQDRLEAKLKMHNPAELKAFYDGFVQMFSAKLVAAIMLYSGLLKREEKLLDTVAGLGSSVLSDVIPFCGDTVGFGVLRLVQFGLDKREEQKVDRVMRYTLTTPLDAIQLAEETGVKLGNLCTAHMKANSITSPVARSKGVDAANAAYSHAQSSAMQQKTFADQNAVAEELATVAQRAVFPTLGQAPAAAANANAPAPSAPPSPAQAKQMNHLTDENQRLRQELEKQRLEAQIRDERLAKLEQQMAKLQSPAPAAPKNWSTQVNGVGGNVYSFNHSK